MKISPSNQTEINQNKLQAVATTKPQAKIIFLVAAILIFLICSLFLFLFLFKTPYASQSAESIQNTIKSTVEQAIQTPIPTPYPFYELTIPYLKEQRYESKLEVLEKVSDTTAYTSYLTSYHSSGLKIDGLLTQPKGEKPKEGWPAVVFIHGYIPPRQYETLGQPYSTYVDYLARNGFVVFKIDLRGHGTSEGEPGGAYYSSDYIVDTLNAYAALQSADFINAKKIGLWGHSMAGNIVMRSIATQPDIPAAVIWAGAGYSYSDLLTYQINDASFDPSQSTSQRRKRREQIRKLYGDPDPKKLFWRHMAPTNYVMDLRGAIQIHHAVDDAVVDVSYSRDLNRVLDNTSVPHELYEYRNGGHNISGENFITAMERTVAFFKKYL